MNATGSLLTKPPVTKREWNNNERWSFREGNVRHAFARVFSEEKNYVLFQTKANEEAKEVLKEYIGFRKDIGHQWEVRKIQEGDKPEYFPGACDDSNGLRFSNGLMDVYERAIDKIANEEIGKEHFSHYPLVETIGVHNNDRDHNAIFWPRVYLVNEKKEKELKNIIDNLSDNKSFGILTELESPQNYRMGEIETLHKLKIPPIVRLPKELSLSVL